MKNLFLMMTFPLFFIACSATQPNLQYDRYETPSDLFRELGLMYRKGSYYEYRGKNLRRHNHHFEGYCKAKNGSWSVRETTLVTPRPPGFWSVSHKNDYTKVSIGRCVVSEKSLFEFKDFWNGREGIAIDGIAKKEYEAKLKEKGQSW